MLSLDDITIHLAKYLLQLKEGERLQSVRSFAKDLNTSVGTVSNALTAIEAANAVTLERRGHMGSFLAARSIGTLWHLSERQPLVIASPLITNPRLEGLASAVKKMLRDAGIDVYLIFIRGSRTRAKALRENRCHIVIMSKFAAAEICTSKEQILLTLPSTSFLLGHEVFYRPGIEDLTRPLRIAIDKDSTDVYQLTHMEFGNDVDYIPISFNQLPRFLIEARVDAGVWSTDDMRGHISPDILHRPLSPHVFSEVGDTSSTATFMGRANHGTVQAVVDACLDPASLMHIQELVMSGEMIPEY